MMGLPNHDEDPVHPSKNPHGSTTISPFDWRLDNARETAPAASPKAPGRPMSARERTERILAHRWGNPYSKPGQR